MSVPGLVEDSLDGEDVAARVDLGGDDELFITPTRTLIYRSEGLLSDESVEEYPHEAERLTVSEGRRKAKLSLEYPLEGTQQFAVPSSTLDAVLHPVLAGVLTGNEITDPGETVVHTYRFSELTLIITSDRLVKHVGSAVWDEDFEEHHYADVTSLSFEDGSVATQIVLEVDGRPERIKAPNEEAVGLQERLKRALCAYHDVESLEEFNGLADTDDTEDRGGATVDFGEGVDPLDANPPELDLDGDTDVGDEPAGGEPAVLETAGNDDTDEQEVAEPPLEEESTVETGDLFEADESQSDADGALLERIERLEAAVDHQTTLLERQQETIDQLIDELRRGR